MGSMPLLSMPTNGAAIRQHRQLAGWNLRPFARHAGVSHGYLSRLERDDTDASPAMLKRIADALGLSVRDLVAVDPPSTPAA